MTTEIGRARKSASPAYRTGWTEQAACEGQDLEDFFAESAKAQNRARAMCRVCPVVATCLTEITSLEDSYRYGVYAGLNTDQRRALPWELALHGQPSIRKAQLLVSEQFEYLLKPHQWSTPDAASSALREQDVHIGSSTVRLAMWWMGYKGARVPQRTAFQRVDREPERIVGLCADTIRRVRSLGASYPDVAAYLGVAQTHCGVAIATIEQADDAALRAQMDLEQAA